MQRWPWTVALEAARTLQQPPGPCLNGMGPRLAVPRDAPIDGPATWESLRADAILRAGLSGTDAHATTIFARRCYALRNLGACMTVGLDGFRSSILMIKMH